MRRNSLQDLGPAVAGRQFVTHTINDQQLRPRDGIGGIPAAFKRYQRIIGAVNYESGDGHGSQGRFPIFLGHHGQELASGSLGIKRSVEQFSGELAVVRLIESKARTGNHTKCSYKKVDIALSLHRRRFQQDIHGFGLGWRKLRISGGAVY